MQPSYEELIREIGVLRRAARILARYSIAQYKRVLQSIEELERQKELLEKKVKERTKNLQEEVKRSQNFAKRLERMAKYDVLTQLPNRFYFQEYLCEQYERFQRYHEGFSIFFIDLDGFKHINDVYGHKAGDYVLQQVAKRLKKGVRRSDFIARLAGDEFVVVFPGLVTKQFLEQIATALLRSIKEPIHYDQQQLHIDASIGIYIYDGAALEDVLVNADIAMYEAKHKGKGRYVFFQKSTKEEYRSLFLTKRGLEEAFAKREFVNYLQPIVSSTQYHIHGAEVLLRWMKDGSIVSPKGFMNILVEMDLILAITRWQLEVCSRCIKKSDKLFLAFNIAAKTLESEMLIDSVQMLKEEGVDLKNIRFELTENDFVKDVARARAILERVSREGVKIVLDDFGIGYSSLSYIRDFPIDIIKIDKEFVKNIESSYKNRRLFYAIIEMAQALGAEVVVEGVETKEQLALIPKEDFIYLQGFYFYRPMPKEHFLAILQKERDASGI